MFQGSGSQSEDDLVRPVKNQKTMQIDIEKHLLFQNQCYDIQL
jgi:hypothetical protein